MKVKIKDMKSQIEGDEVLNALASMLKATGGINEGRKDILLDEAADMAASKCMEQSVAFMSKAMRLLGDDDDPILPVARVIAKCAELVLVNMLARLDDDVDREALEQLQKYLNELLAVKLRNGVDIVDMHKQLRSQVKNALNDAE